MRLPALKVECSTQDAKEIRSMRVTQSVRKFFIIFSHLCMKRKLIAASAVIAGSAFVLPALAQVSSSSTTDMTDVSSSSVYSVTDTTTSTGVDSSTSTTVTDPNSGASVDAGDTSSINSNGTAIPASLPNTGAGTMAEVVK